MTYLPFLYDASLPFGLISAPFSFPFSETRCNFLTPKTPNGFTALSHKRPIHIVGLINSLYNPIAHFGRNRHVRSGP